MPRTVTPFEAVPDATREAAIRAIAGRLAAQKEEVARRVVDCAVREIVDYETPGDRHLLGEAFTAALEHVEALVVSLETGKPVPDKYLEQLRQLAARRLHQGVPLESVLHAARLWEMVTWDAVRRLARSGFPKEQEAALDIGTRILRLAAHMSTVVTDAYLDELTDRGLLRRDLLDALLTAKGDGRSATRLARMLRIRLADNYIVVIVRGEGVEIGDAREQPPAARSRLDRVVEETRRHVRPSAGSLLTGMRNGDLVVLYPATSPGDLDAVRQDCEALAAALGGDSCCIGMSGWHEGLAAIRIAYAEAKDALQVAATAGIRGRAVRLDEVLVDRLIEASEPAQRILKETLRPLLNYDAARKTALVATLRAYLDARLNVTKSAEVLFVNPNTIVYRLRRIKELTGRDPHDPDDLLVLSLAMKLADLRPDDVIGIE